MWRLRDTSILFYSILFYSILFYSVLLFALSVGAEAYAEDITYSEWNLTVCEGDTCLDCPGWYSSSVCDGTAGVHGRPLNISGGSCQYQSYYYCADNFQIFTGAPINEIDCNSCVVTGTSAPSTDVDADGDGHYPLSAATTPHDDCNDGDAAVNPEKPEICDGKDNDCNPDTPDGKAETWLDAICDGDDADNYEDGVYVCDSGVKTCTDDPEIRIEAAGTGPTFWLIEPHCGNIPGSQQQTRFCKSTRSTYTCNRCSVTYISAEVPNTAPYGIDYDFPNNCWKELSYNCGDNRPPKGYTFAVWTNLDQCPGVAKDCIWGQSCNRTVALDNDGDGHYSLSSCIAPNDDCNDNIGTGKDIFPGAVEKCDNIDSDCDKDFEDVTPKSCYYGPEGTENVGICKGGTQSCSNGVWGSTCVDEVKPQVETYDGKDNDCNGKTDDVCFDNDDDHFLSGEYCPDASDCDDSDRFSNPMASESCDGKDNDCDGKIDEDVIRITSFSGSTTSVNPAAGGAIDFTGTISATQPDSVKWRVILAGELHEGEGTDVYINWDGKNILGQMTPPGTYFAALSAIIDDFGAVCSDRLVETFTVGQDASCNMLVDFGSAANVASGNLYHSQDLFTANGAALPASFKLSYNSLDGYSGPLGSGWTHSFNMRLTAHDDGSYTLMEGDGDRVLLVKNGDVYTPPNAAYPALSINPDGSYLYRKEGVFYLFDSGGKITSIKDLNGNAVSLTYNILGNLAEIEDTTGRTTTLGYDSSGRIISVKDPGGNTYTLGYGINSLIRVTNPDGKSWAYAYDPNGYMLSKTDPAGFIITYEYDNKHRVRKSIDPEGNAKTIAYNPDSAVSQVTERDGSIWTYKYDTQNGVLTEKTDPEGGTTSYTYDENRNMTTRTEPDGSVTSYTYDIYGNTTSVTDPEGNVTQYTYNELSRVTSVTDSEGDVISYGYDERGNLTSITDTEGAKTLYQYDSKGNITEITDPDGNQTVFTYDSVGNIASITDSTGAKTSFTYDAVGNMTSQTDSQGNVTTYQYDSRGRLIGVIDPKGGNTTSMYDANGNRTSETDANGNTTYFEYNFKGQLVKVTDAKGNVTQYTYGGSGCSSCGGGGDNLTSITDANGNVTSYKYDSLGRVIKETDALGVSITYTYDSKGNLKTRTDGKGNVTAYNYDALGRLLKKTYPDGTVEVFEYDRKGNVVYAGNQYIAYSLTYDSSGRITSVVEVPSFPGLTGESRTIQYEYDLSGNKVKMTGPDGMAAAYAYDAGRLSKIVSDAGTFIFTYDSSGKRTKLSMPNGTYTSYVYDESGRLTALTHKTSTGSVIDSFIYTHDKVGNRLSKAAPARITSYAYDPVYQLLEAVSSTPGWSSNNKGKGGGITTALDNQKESYSYDPVGNRLIGPDKSNLYTYNQGNQLVSSSNANYEYDLNGNLVTKVSAEGIASFSYDYENRLTRVIMPDGTTATFIYDPFGRRISKSVNGTATYYFYDNEDILFEYDSTGVVGNRYIHGPGVDEPFALNNKATYYYHADGLDSIVALTDTAQKVVQTYEYDSFGKLKDLKNRIKQPYAFTGREYDRETGMYYYRARYYDPVIGRFVSYDPILHLNANDNNKACRFKKFERLMSDGMYKHPYVYVVGDPINKVDPSGLVATIGCSAPDIQKINIATSKAVGASQSCLPECDRDKFKNKVRALAVKCIPRTRSVYYPDLYICGKTYFGSSVIQITPDGLTGIGCGCLESTILHEVTHTIGYDEDQAVDAEKKCFNCSSSNNSFEMDNKYKDNLAKENQAHSTKPFVSYEYIWTNRDNDGTAKLWVHRLMDFFVKLFGPEEVFAAEINEALPLQLTIGVPKRTFSVQEQIPLSVELKNISDKPIIGWWFFEGFYHRLTEGGKRFPEVISDVLIIDENGNKILFRGKWIVKMKTITLNDFAAIMPGQSHKFAINIQDGEDQFGINKKGTYSIRLLYGNNSKTWIEKEMKEERLKGTDLSYPLSLYWDGKLSSNEIRITVE